MTMMLNRLLNAEKANGRAAMTAISLIALIEVTTGNGLISTLRAIDLQSLWWTLGIYSA